MIYEDFLATKRRFVGAHGFEVSASAIHPRLFPFQSKAILVVFTCDCGLVYEIDEKKTTLIRCPCYKTWVFPSLLGASA